MSQLKQQTILGFLKKEELCEVRLFDIKQHSTNLCYQSAYSNSYSETIAGLTNMPAFFTAPKIPRTGAGITLIMKILSPRAWVSGIISKKERRHLRRSLALKRRQFEMISYAPGDKLKKNNDIKSTEIEIGNKVIDLIKSHASKAFLNSFINRSKKLPIDITNDINDLLYMNHIDGRRVGGEYTRMGGLVTSLHDKSIMMAYSGFSAKDKTARAIIKMSRRFIRKTKTQGFPEWFLFVADMKGPIRQLKNIMDGIMHMARQILCDIYISDEIRHTLRCHVDVEERPIKIISETLSIDTVRIFGKPFGYGGNSRIIKCGKRVGSSVTVTPKAYKVIEK